MSHAAPGAAGRASSTAASEAGPLRVLITAIGLTSRDGSTLYARDLALELARQGHRPAVYSPRLGEVADELRRGDIEVVDDLSALTGPPDVVHGNHTVETALALLHHPGVPAVFVCHGQGWMAEPPGLTHVERYVAVGTATWSRLVDVLGLPAERCSLVPNGVDTERFAPSGRELPARPRRALLFSNNAAPGGYLELVREACAARDIALDVAGQGVGRPLAEPHTVLPGYDLVFARGRCAREALSAGCAVVLIDDEGLGAFVDPGHVAELNVAALGAAALTRPHDVELIGREIDRYDPERAAAVTRFVREEGSLHHMVEQLCTLYRAAMVDARAHEPDPAADLQWLVGYLPVLSGLGLERDEVLLSRHLMAQHLRSIEGRLTVAEEERQRLHHELDAARAERDEARSTLEELRATRLVRARSRALDAPVVGTGLRAAARATARLGRHRSWTRPD